MGGIVGIDVGGTFTDLFYSSDGPTPDMVLKVPSTPDDPSRGLIDALVAASIDPASIEIIVHGTTIATNAVIERKGARCALVTTRGFRDVLELGRRDRRHVYGLTGTHEPLIPREMRWEIDERVDHRGRILKALDENQVGKLAAALKDAAIDAVIIAFLHSYANTAHEEAARAIFAAANPAWEVVTSSGVVQEYFEFERTSTAVVQGYLQPLVARYARNLAAKLAERNFEVRTLVMQSNGGLVPLKSLPERAAHIVRSGPAAGVVAAAKLAAAAGFDRVITGDMGGTSYDVAVVVNGVPRVAETTELDFRIPVRLPMIDVHTIGAGGGSIAYRDRGGMLQVGPASAGADPGPACFGRGGTEPTVTDANVVLARINARKPIGLRHLTRLDEDAARSAVGELGRRVGLGVEAAAEAILTIANQKMASRTRLLSVDAGYDPREFALVVFGGAGPLHGAAIMREVGIGAMLLPSHPGVLCAVGCAIADLRYDFSQTVERPLAQLDDQWIAGVLGAQRLQGEASIAESEAPLDQVVVSHDADMSYTGQIHALRVRIAAGWQLPQLVRAFEETYVREYGNTLGDIPLTLVSLKTVVRGIRRQVAPEVPKIAGPSQAVARERRRVYYSGQWVETAIYDRENFRPGMMLDGPAIIEQSDTTTVIEPGMRARVDRFGNVLVEVA